MELHGQYGNMNRCFQRPFKKLSGTYNFNLKMPPILPKCIDLRNTAKVEIYDQGQTNSCTANALCAAYSILNILNGNPPISLSRLFIYYNSRLCDNSQSTDTGANLYNCFLMMQLNGCCLESLWLFDKNNITVQPSMECYTQALKHCAQQHSLLNPRNILNEIRECLANNKPVVIGISIYESFITNEVAMTGFIPLPAQTEKLLGGHALVAIGYDDVLQGIIVQNSWGSTWGQQGYSYLPYAYIMDPNLTSDCHAFMKIEINRSVLT
jgi:C1A family cysteine protease